MLFMAPERFPVHISHLNQVFVRLRAHGIMIKGSKVKLGVKELPLLAEIASTTVFTHWKEYYIYTCTQ